MSAKMNSELIKKKIFVSSFPPSHILLHDLSSSNSISYLLTNTFFWRR